MMKRTTNQNKENRANAGRKSQLVFREFYDDPIIKAVESDISSSIEDDDDFVIMMNTTEQRKIERSISKDSEMEEEQKKRHSKAVAAGVTTGAVGLVFGGPIIGALVGIGTTAIAKMDQHSVVGDAARSVGDLALVATDKVKEIDEKHQISAKTGEKVKEIDQKLHVTEKGTEMVIKTAKTIEKISDNYHFVQHVNSVGNKVNCVSHKVNDQARGIFHKMWSDFQTHILLLDDDAEFDKQVAYLYMQRTLEQEENDLRLMRQQQREQK